MKTNQSFFNLLLFFLAGGFLFAGCYTRMETMSDEGSDATDNGDYAAADSSGASNDTTGNNYFSDDDYRSSQYRTAFDYYYPSSYGIDPWYSDYDYPWDATLAYPYPYWDGAYPYYGWGWGFGLGYGFGYGYGHYYNGGYHGGRGGSFYAGRVRTIGSTRGGVGFLRARGGAVSAGTIPGARGAVSSRTTNPTAPQVTASNAARTRSREEIPWWQSAKATTANSSGRTGVAARTQASGRKVSMANRARYMKTSSYSANARRVYQSRGRTQATRPARFGPQSRQASPHSFSPQGGGGRSNGGGSRGGGGGGSRSGGGSRTR